MSSTRLLVPSASHHAQQIAENLEKAFFEERGSDHGSDNVLCNRDVQGPADDKARSNSVKEVEENKLGVPSHDNELSINALDGQRGIKEANMMEYSAATAIWSLGMEARKRKVEENALTQFSKKRIVEHPPPRLLFASSNYVVSRSDTAEASVEHSHDSSLHRTERNSNQFLIDEPAAHASGECVDGFSSDQSDAFDEADCRPEFSSLPVVLASTDYHHFNQIGTSNNAFGQFSQSEASETRNSHHQARQSLNNISRLASEVEASHADSQSCQSSTRNKASYLASKTEASNAIIRENESHAATINTPNRLASENETSNTDSQENKRDTTTTSSIQHEVRNSKASNTNFTAAAAETGTSSTDNQVNERETCDTASQEQEIETTTANNANCSARKREANNSVVKVNEIEATTMKNANRLATKKETSNTDCQGNERDETTTSNAKGLASKREAISTDSQPKGSDERTTGITHRCIANCTAAENESSLTVSQVKVPTTSNEKDLASKSTPTNNLNYQGSRSEARKADVGPRRFGQIKVSNSANCQGSDSVAFSNAHRQASHRKKIDIGNSDRKGGRTTSITTGTAPHRVVQSTLLSNARPRVCQRTVTSDPNKRQVGKREATAMGNLHRQVGHRSATRAGDAPCRIGQIMISRRICRTMVMDTTKRQVAERWATSNASRRVSQRESSTTNNSHRRQVDEIIATTMRDVPRRIGQISTTVKAKRYLALDTPRQVGHKMKSDKASHCVSEINGPISSHRYVRPKLSNKPGPAYSKNIAEGPVVLQSQLPLSLSRR